MLCSVIYVEYCGYISIHFNKFSCNLSAGFDKLAMRLSFQDVKNDEVFKNLISHCMPGLLKIQLMPVMGHLLQNKVIR